MKKEHLLILFAIAMVVTTTAEAECGNLCDYKWWETATDSDLRMELNPSLIDIKEREARLFSWLHGVTHQLILIY